MLKQSPKVLVRAPYEAYFITALIHNFFSPFSPTLLRPLHMERLLRRSSWGGPSSWPEKSRNFIMKQLQNYDINNHSSDVILKLKLITPCKIIIVNIHEHMHTFIIHVGWWLWNLDRKIYCTIKTMINTFCTFCTCIFWTSNTTSCKGTGEGTVTLLYML